MIHAVALPLVAGLLVGVNPYTAPLLRAKLRDQPARPARFLIEIAALLGCVLLVIVILSWRFSAFVSGRLTNGLLVLGLFALAGAFFSLRPPRRPQEPRAVSGWRWHTRYASDLAYTAGPAWLVATAIAMTQLTLARFVLPYVAAAVGILVAHAYWTTRGRQRLPEAILPDRPRTRSHFQLALAYGATAVLVLAGYLKLI